MYEHDGCVDTPVFTVNRWTKCEEPWNESPLFLHPAPAAPQAEPSAALIRAYNSGYMQGHHDTVESCFTDIHQSDMDTFHADLVAELGLSAAPQAEPIDPHMSVADDRFPDEQAEPKRGPLTDERIASVCLSYRHDFGLLSGDEQTGLMLEARAWERAFRKEWQRC
jgi:hypothetical protein